MKKGVQTVPEDEIARCLNPTASHHPFIETDSHKRDEQDPRVPSLIITDT